jgi:hypothetical protein
MKPTKGKNLGSGCWGRVVQLDTIARNKYAVLIRAFEISNKINPQDKKRRERERARESERDDDITKGWSRSKRESS